MSQRVQQSFLKTISLRSVLRKIHNSMVDQSIIIAIKYHFIRDQVDNNNVELRYCRTNVMIADMLTKGLNGEQFVKLRRMAGVREMIDHSVCN